MRRVPQRFYSKAFNGNNLVGGQRKAENKNAGNKGNDAENGFTVQRMEAGSLPAAAALKNPQRVE